MSGPRFRPDVPGAALAALYRADYSAEEIGAAMDCAPRTVLLRLRARGIQIRPRGSGSRNHARVSLGPLRVRIAEIRARAAQEITEAVTDFFEEG